METISLPTFCTVCQGLLIRLQSYLSEQPQARCCRQSVAFSAEKGCPWIEAVVTFIYGRSDHDHYEKDMMCLRFELEKETSNNSSKRCFHIVFRLALMDGDVPHMKLDPSYDMYERSSLPVSVTRPSPNTGDPGPLRLIKQWVDDCVQKHVTCGAARYRDDGSPVVLPTRLLAVVDASRVRLVDDFGLSTLSTPMKYVTLSHRWRPSKMPRLLRANYDHYKECIETSSLPSVFKDAIIMTRQLGIGYIWIDCLCIIQDDKLDWDIESSRMGQIYSGALCNFGACAAADSLSASVGYEKHDVKDVGLFVKRDTRALHLPAVSIVRRNHRNLYYAYTNQMHPKLALSSLVRRGWVLQERLMSTRSIYFTSHLGWECAEVVACEAFPAGMPAVPVTAPWGNVGTPFKINNLLGYILPDSSNARNINEGTEIERKWLCVAERFQSCRLTFEDDRLPALSGLAQCFHSVLHDEYLAGVWRNDLYRSLLWYRTNPRADLHTQSDSHLLPTWSWASSRGSIRFPLAHQHFFKYEEEQTVFTLLEVTVSTLTSDPFGKVKNGYIRLAGHMRESSECRTDTRTDELEKRKYNDRYDCDSSKQNTYHFLLGYSRCIFEAEKGPTRVLRGLIVSRAENPSHVYRRVGMFMHPWRPPGHNDLNIFREFLDFKLNDPTVTITLV